MKLIINEPLENAPPSLAFATVAMGAFRGLVVDILWIRADSLKEKGQFFDAKQLAEWITILQPRFTDVWEFHAWNMAYNISAAIPATEPEQRWRWVRNGYELLRDKGIRINPKSIVLYRELARIFQHKIGGVTDDAHNYYKLQLALAMGPLLGAADNHSFDELAKAPTDFQQIAADPNIASLIAALKNADTIFNDNENFAANYLNLRQHPHRFNDKAFGVIDAHRTKAALKKLDAFARASQLRNVWKLDPVMIRQLNQTYGPADLGDPNTHLPLEWRHPCTHAMYWAVLGLKNAAKEEFSVGETNTDRIVSHSLQDLFRNGKIFIYDVQLPSAPDESLTKPAVPIKEIYLRPDLRMFEQYNKSVLATIEKYRAINKKGTFQSMQDGHRNMLVNAAFSFYQAGHINQAQKIYNQLRKLYPKPEFNVSLVIFVRNRLREELRSLGIHNAREIIQMMLRESYFRYAMRDDDEAAGREKMAQQTYEQYKSVCGDEQRVNLPDFKMLRYLALLDFLDDRRYPPNLRQNLIGRIKIERPKLAEQLEEQQRKLIQQMEEQTEKQ